jgi:hypothetical protein
MAVLNWGAYFALATAGVEMVVPIIIGYYLDAWLGWTPWLTAAGVVLGLVGSLLHLIILLKRFENPQTSPGRAVIGRLFSFAALSVLLWLLIALPARVWGDATVLTSPSPDRLPRPRSGDARLGAVVVESARRDTVHRRPRRHRRTPLRRRCDYHPARAERSLPGRMASPPGSSCSTC